MSEKPIVRSRHRLPTETESFSLARAKIAELDVRDQLDPFVVEMLSKASEEEAEAFIEDRPTEDW